MPSHEPDPLPNCTELWGSKVKRLRHAHAQANWRNVLWTKSSNSKVNVTRSKSSKVALLSGFDWGSACSTILIIKPESEH